VSKIYGENLYLLRNVKPPVLTIDLLWFHLTFKQYFPPEFILHWFLHLINGPTLESIKIYLLEEVLMQKVVQWYKQLLFTYRLNSNFLKCSKT
jgi:hypothetical protein